MSKRSLVQYGTSSEKDIEVDYDYNPTLLYLHISDSDWYQTLHSIQDNPTQARIWVVKTENKGKRNQSQCRFLPLHSACAREPPLVVVSALLEAYPEGAGKKDDNGMCPLHYATANHASAEVVRVLINYYPQALFQRVESSGALPIHLAAQWGVSSISVMEHILENNNSLAAARDGDGLCPLEIAIDADYIENKVGIINLLRDSMLQETLEHSSTLTSKKSTESMSKIEIDCSPSDPNKHLKSKSQTKSMNSKLYRKRSEMLTKEIKKLRSGSAYIKSSAEEQIALEWEAVHMALDELDQRMYDQKEKNANIDIIKHTICSRDDAVEVNLDPEEVRDENIKLETEIKKLDKVYNQYLSKVETVELIIKRLAETMTNAAKNHTVTMTRLKKRESEMLRMNKLRAKKLAELAKEVDAFASNLSSYDYKKQEKKAFNVMIKEQQVLEKMSEIIRALKS